MRVVIPEDYQRAVERLSCISMLDGHDVVVDADASRDLDARAAKLAGAEALVLIRERTPIDDALLERLPALRLICQTGHGTGHIDLDACTRRGVVVCAGPGSPIAPAELTFALILASARHLQAEADALRAGAWQTTVGSELHGRTLGIVGYGRIGALVASYGRAFGMHVLAWGREGSLERARADGIDAEPDLGSLFEQADVASLHLRLSAETRNTVTAAHLARMRPTALFVNTARAGLVTEGALEAALAAGRPGRAAVDVFADEPAIGDPLLTDESVLATPHLGYVTWETYELYFGRAFAQVEAFATGAPVDVVNPAALARPERG